VGGRQAGSGRTLTAVAGRPFRPAPAAGVVGAGEPRRELVLAAITVVALGRLADGPALAVIAAGLAGAVLLGTRHVLADLEEAHDAPALSLAPLIPPVLAALACLGVIRLVPLGLALVPALVGATILVDRTIGTEARIIAALHRPTDSDRARVVIEALVIAFLAFIGIAAAVPGGLPEPGADTSASMSEGGLLALAALDGAAAGLLGYRLSALRVSSAGPAIWSAATYAGVVALAAAALRATDIPRFVGPALLTLVFFLWDAFHGAPPARRRDPRWIWQTVLLVLLGVVVIAWNLGLRSAQGV
jgi:hypothetical protein